MAIQDIDTHFVQGLYSYHIRNTKPNSNDGTSGRSNIKIPHEVWLPMDIVVQIRYNDESIYELFVKNQAFFIGKRIRDDNVVEVYFPDCPTFYKKSLSDGTPMNKVLQLAGKDCLKIYPHNYCEFESLDCVCKFCTVDSSRELQDIIYNKGICQIGEAMKAAYAEGYYGHVMIAMGVLATNDRGLSFISNMLKYIRATLGIDLVAGSASTVPPREFRYIHQIYDAGIEYITFNLEVFDKELFEKYCPGKAKYIGRQHYFDCYKEAVEIFGPGRVRSNFVAGMEPIESMVEGFELLANMGVVPTVTMLSLNERNKKNIGADFKFPDFEYYIDIFKNLWRIYQEYEMTPPWCAQCRTTSLEHECEYL